MLPLMKVADKAVSSRVFPLINQLEDPVPLLTIRIEAGHKHIEPVPVHGIVDANSGVAPDRFLHFEKQRERFPLFQTDEVLFVFEDQLAQLLVKFQNIIDNCHSGTYPVVSTHYYYIQT
jgi:hypothetical protein